MLSLSNCKPHLDSGRNREARCRRQWGWTSGKWPGLIAEVEGEYPGSVSVWDPSSVKRAMLEQLNRETFLQFIIVSVVGSSRASAYPGVDPASSNGWRGECHRPFPLGPMLQLVRVKFRGNGGGELYP